MTDPSSLALYLVVLLLGGALVAALLGRVPRVSLLVSAGVFAAAEVGIGVLASGRDMGMVPPLDTGLLSLAGFRVDTASLLVLFCAASYLLVHSFAQEFENRGRLGPLFLLACGAGLMAAASDNLLVTCVGLELGALAAHGITAFPRLTPIRTEALWKQYSFHAIGSACLWLSVALFHTIFGSLSLGAIREAALSEPSSPLIAIACLLMLLGMAERLSVFPFVSIAPDTGEGSAWGSIFHETAGRYIALAAFLPIFLETLLPLKSMWLDALSIMGALTLAWGALGSVIQDNLRRLLAYLGQAQAGWLMLFAASSARSGSLDLHFLPATLVFALVALGLSAGVSLIERETRDSDIYQLSGLGETHPIMALWWTVLCLAGAGFPPTGGFSAQVSFLVRLSGADHVLWLLPVAAALVALAYSYLRMVAYLYGRECRETITLTHRAALPIACASTCAVLTIFLLFLWK